MRKDLLVIFADLEDVYDLGINRVGILGTPPPPTHTHICTHSSCTTMGSTPLIGAFTYVIRQLRVHGGAIFFFFSIIHESSCGACQG